MNKKFVRSLIAAAVCMTASTAAMAQAEVRGAGASFPGPVYEAWAFKYSKDKTAKVNFVPTGSGDGIKQIQARAVDFGASDVPLSREELTKNNLIQFPTMVGGIVPVINLPKIAD